MRCLFLISHVNRFCGKQETPLISTDQRSPLKFVEWVLNWIRILSHYHKQSFLGFTQWGEGDLSFPHSLVLICSMLFYVKQDPHWLVETMKTMWKVLMRKEKVAGLNWTSSHSARLCAEFGLVVLIVLFLQSRKGELVFSRAYLSYFDNSSSPSFCIAGIKLL